MAMRNFMTVLVLCLSVQCPSAWAFYCGHYVVMEGDDKLQVLQKCLVNSFFAICLAFFCALGHARAFAESADYAGVSQIGMASYYSDKFHGRRTANGERYDRNGLTAVHSRLPFGSLVRVTNLRNNRSVVLRINDRKHARNRCLLDVSKRAALELGFAGAGLAKVEVEVVRWGDS